MDLCVRNGSFTINLYEDGAIRSINDKYPSCGVRIEANVDNTKFLFFGLSLGKHDLESVITYIDKTLKNEIVGTHRLRFEDPHVAGKSLYSPITFMINGFENHEEDYWQFNCGNLDGRHTSGGNDYSICLNRKDIANIRTEIIAEMKKIDWENHGKTWFYQIDLPESDYEDCYLAIEFEKKLNFFCGSSCLRKVFISLDSYLFRQQYKKNSYFFGYGSQVLLVFDRFIFDLQVYAEGLFKYCVREGIDLAKNEPLFERVPEKGVENCFCDTKKMFTVPYEDTIIESCFVKSTDSAPFGYIKLDDLKDKDLPELPERVVLALDNNHSIEIYGDPIEFFGILMK
jgi:hypothetical protein